MVVHDNYGTLLRSSLDSEGDGTDPGTGTGEERDLGISDDRYEVGRLSHRRRGRHSLEQSERTSFGRGTKEFREPHLGFEE